MTYFVNFPAFGSGLIKSGNDIIHGQPVLLPDDNQPTRQVRHNRQ